MLFLGFDACVEPALNILQSLFKRRLGALGDLVADEEADVVHLLPFVLQSQERTDLEVAGGDVEPLGELAPIVEVAEDLPVRVAVIHQEEFGAGLTCHSGPSETRGGKSNLTLAGRSCKRKPRTFIHEGCTVSGASQRVSQRRGKFSDPLCVSHPRLGSGLVKDLKNLLLRRLVVASHHLCTQSAHYCGQGGNGVASGELGNVSVVPRHGRVAVADDCLDYRQRRVGFATHAHEGVPQ